jgi:hypothetical protein
VTREGRSVIDASPLSGRRDCVKSVEDFGDEEIDVQLVSAKTVKKGRHRASVSAVLREDGRDERWLLALVRRGGWLVDAAELAG